MQQLSLLPSSGAAQAGSQGVSVNKPNDASPRFKQAYGEAENALKNEQRRNDPELESRHSDSAIEEKYISVGETGNELPENSDVLPTDSGKTLPLGAVDQRAESSASEVEELRSSIAVSVAQDGKGALSADPLANAISALASANGSATDKAQGRGVGMGVLADGSSLAVSQAAGAPGGLSNSAPIMSAASLLDSSELAPSQLSGNVVASGVAQSHKSNFQFEVNGASQMSESANAKLSELAAKAATTANAVGSGVSGVSSASEKPPAGVAQSNVLQGAVLGPAIKAGEGVLPQQAASVNGSALSGVNSNALASGSEQAQFNRALGGEISSQAATNAAADPVNGLQAESELRFKAAMESVQSARVTDVADSVDVNAIKLDASAQSGKGSELKAAEAQAQNAARPYVSSLGIPVDDAEWSNQLGQKLMWMNARNIQSAELHLNPADLGPIDVRIQLGGDQSSISFNTQNQGVRELLEANIHRLREMLNNPTQAESDHSGGMLGQDSGTESQSQSQAQSNGESGANQVGSSISSGSGESERSASAQSSFGDNRLVDAYV